MEIAVAGESRYDLDNNSKKANQWTENEEAWEWLASKEVSLRKLYIIRDERQTTFFEWHSH